MGSSVNHLIIHIPSPVKVALDTKKAIKRFYQYHHITGMTTNIFFMVKRQGYLPEESADPMMRFTLQIIQFMFPTCKNFFQWLLSCSLLNALVIELHRKKNTHHEVIMMHKLIVAVFAVLIFCFSAERIFAGPGDNLPAKIDWQVQGEWKLPSSPLAVVYSLDQKHVFVLTDKHQVLVYDATGKIEGTIPVSKGVKAIDIAPRGESLYLIDSEKNTFTTVAVDFILPINIAGSPFQGKENAPVTIVEFSDFE